MALNMTAAQADRMLRNAIETDVTLRRLRDGRYATRSAKTPNGLTYLTTSDSCTCRGFARWGRCKHVAAVLFEGPEPPTPATEPAVQITTICQMCQATKTIDRWLNRHSARHAGESCPHCHGTGRVSQPARIVAEAVA